MSQSPILKALLVAVIAVMAASFFYWPKPGKTTHQKYPLEEATGYGAAEVAAKVLGEAGGDVVLIVWESQEKFFPGSENEARERGFKQAIANHPNVRCAGHFLGAKLLPQNHNVIPDGLKLGTLQAARESFPKATLFVSFFGLPQLGAEEESQWLNTSPPKVLVVGGPLDADEMKTAKRMRESGLLAMYVQRNNQAAPPTKDLKGTPNEIFERFYEILTP